ncbi:hypothetical protein SDC9_187760 [bioreactor metagenome]|uniref:Uncharacterized protein n=1 Tax=bioreactor metagenome TaxID=1076179 RepID=A0A645HVM7_9ZZZZ
MDDAFLHLHKVGERLRHADDHAVEPHGVNRHGSGRHDEAALGGDGQRHADGVAAAKHERHGRLFHAGDHLRDGEPGLDVTANGVQDDEQTADVGAFLDRGELGDDMLVLCRLGRRRQYVVTLDLADNG